MNTIFNQYSFIILSAGLLGVAGVILLTRKPKWNDYLAFGVIAGVLILAWVIVHPRQTALMEDAKMVQQMIGAGTPVLLEFQSPFCVGCTAIQPLVNSLEEELGDKIHIIRINAQETVGQELAPVYGFNFTPTFIMFDSKGTELWRQVGELNPQKVRESLQ
jgi:thioredoxin 1